jgi:hypothetical protein
MVREIAPRVALELKARYRSLEQCQRALVVHSVNGNGRTCDAANEYVVRGSWVVLSEVSRHASKFAHLPEHARPVVRRIWVNVHGSGSGPHGRGQTRNVRVRPRCAGASSRCAGPPRVVLAAARLDM